MSVIVDDPKLVYRRALGFYAATTIPATVFGLLFSNFFFIYATDVLLLAPAIVGTLLAIARIYDGLSDIAIAAWSDRVESARGRRRPFILAAGVMIGFSFIIWWHPPGLSQTALIGWLLFALLWIQTANTLRSIPLQALGIESGKTPVKRTWFNLAISLLVIPFIVLGNFLGEDIINADDPRAAVLPWAIGLCGAAMLMTFVAYPFLKELPTRHRSVERNLWKMAKEVLSVGYHRKLIAVQFAEAFAFTSLGFSVTYVMTYVLDSPGSIAVIFIIYSIVQRVSGLGWMWLIPRIGMKQCWLWGFYLWLVAFAFVPFILIAGLPLYIGLTFLAGIAGGGAQVNFAMLGDVADYDARKSGRERQGIYMTIYQLVGNIGGAATAFALGWFLQLSGYVANQEQGDMTIAAIVACSSILPFVGVLIGIRILKSYDLYEREEVSDGRRESREEESAVSGCLTA